MLDTNCEKFIEQISKTKLACVDKFAPQKSVKIQYISNDWITNKIKNAKQEKKFTIAFNRKVKVIKSVQQTK